ncbi:MAG TPA: ankyrin repeat domain-containing protein [Candidatus Solibacter sp.]|nr:ankyrin repeat domain-containing protein [Candidatus Solibacter sp.]
MIRPIDLTDDDLWGLFNACCTGDIDTARALIEHRPELVNREYNYTAPLHFAVREGHLPVVRLLLERGANPIYQTHRFLDSLLTMAEDREYHELAGELRPLTAERCDTALHEAAAAGDLDAIHRVLNAGANIDAVRPDGKRPIHCALAAGHTDAVRTLLTHGTEYNFYLAVALGDSAYVGEALKRDAPLANFEDTSHQRPISAAAWRNDLDMMKMLLDHGADPSLPEHGAPDGLALWVAVYQNQPEMVKLLLERGANPNTSPESSGSALMHARKNPELEALLLQYGARDEVSPRKSLETAINDNDLDSVEVQLQQDPALVHDPMMFWAEGILATAANSAPREMIELLLRHGASIPAVVKWGPQYYFKHAEIGKLLLERGMTPNQMNWQRFTLLHYFSAAGDTTKVRILLEHGAQIDALDEEYRSTPLACAARWGERDTARLLLERGANPNLAGASWSTPLAWTRKKGHTVIEADLLAAGAK